MINIKKKHFKQKTDGWFCNYGIRFKICSDINLKFLFLQIFNWFQFL